MIIVVLRGTQQVSSGSTIASLRPHSRASTVPCKPSLCVELFLNIRSMPYKRSIHEQSVHHVALTLTEARGRTKIHVKQR